MISSPLNKFLSLSTFCTHLSSKLLEIIDFFYSRILYVISIIDVEFLDINVH